MHERLYGSRDFRDPFVDAIEATGEKTILYSDDTHVVDYVVDRLGDQIEIIEESPKKKDGEVHLSDFASRVALNQGVSVLADVWTMSNSTRFIHGTSNMTNFVLGLNPELVNVNIYESTDRNRA